jgi:hypothetical protein
LTSFTAAEEWGLQRWERREIHVLAPSGTHRPNIDGLVLHRVGDWRRVTSLGHRRLHELAPSLVVAASSFKNVRSACGILAAAVQQRLVRADDLRSAVLAAPRTRHRRSLLLAVTDLAQGADALSEVDLGRLCRRYRLPAPTRQAVRVEPDGTCRYLDAEWVTPDGRTLGLEVDGAHHMEATQWQADPLRQNLIVLGGTMVLRFPSVVRDQPELVAAQLRQALFPPDLVGMPRF